MKEESEEVFAAIDNHDMENLCEELGDVLFQVLMHSRIAEENGAFTMDDVINGLCEKMVRRHPHVFGDAKAATPEAVSYTHLSRRPDMRACSPGSLPAEIIGMNSEIN